jgi:hypothetical protein
MANKADENWKNIVGEAGYTLRSRVSAIRGWSGILKMYLDQLKQDGIPFMLRDTSEITADEALEKIMEAAEYLNLLEYQLREELHKPHDK